MSDLEFEQDKEWLKYQNSYWDESQRMPILVKLVMNYMEKKIALP